MRGVRKTHVGLAALVAMTVVLGRGAADPVDAPEDLEALTARFHAAMKEANPGYQGGGTLAVHDGVLTTISLVRCRNVHDLSPLTQFDLSGVRNVVLYATGNITDLSPLKACRLQQLNTERCAAISDLSPLQGMPMTSFRMYANTLVKDLSPLKGMPLRHFDMGKCPLVEDLSPLEGMPLRDLRMDECPKITDIALLKDMPLKFLSVFGCDGIKDYSPLAGLELETLLFSPELLSEEEIEMVRGMDSLTFISRNWEEWSRKQTAEDFWKDYDAKKQ